ncbi:hypothetical protein CERZMDRAFT_83536 [Cercospora zeae-maydis SCOH1-5]|uniref:F-box domain-containing protein n=1 Tax=Cercospora zeae-maydis SCOH1-5 TaxID=717836 RepID=A0A6A6FLI0_9PEZI|nr:hypothetical protein CERZMDRAFT_83536 [Cercospora zeae-maydis SCOH1-5]
MPCKTHEAYTAKALEEAVRTLRAENARLRAAQGVTHNEEQAAEEQTVGKFDTQGPGAEVTAHILSLPSELLDSIFIQLSGDQPLIATCRLVCRQFKDLSSPYLITSVILSHRCKAIRKLYAVCDSDYFSKYVTELVWDASVWSKQCVLDFELYYNNALASGRPFHAPETDAEQREWILTRSLLEKYSPHDRDGVPSIEKIEPCNDQGFYGTVIRDSHHLGQHQYSRFWREQQALKDRRAFHEASKHCERHLPRLTKLTITDYRCFARSDDTSYSDFCHRTLGLSAPPHHLGVLHFSRENSFARYLFAPLLGPIKGIKSFSIGENPFGYPLGTQKHCPLWECYRAQAISLQHLQWFDESLDATEDYVEFFAGLHDLRLPLRLDHWLNENSDYIEGNIRSSPMPRMLAACTQNLVRLTFAAEDVVDWNNSYDRPSKWTIVKGTIEALEMILYPVTFRKLAYLDLRGWHLYHSSFCEFLGRHKATLKQIRLVGNLVSTHFYLIGNIYYFTASSEIKLGKWAGRNLALDGIAIDNFPSDYKQPPNADGSYPAMPGIPPHYTEVEKSYFEELWLAGRDNILSKLSVEVRPCQRNDEQRQLTWRNAELWAR